SLLRRAFNWCLLKCFSEIHTSDMYFPV
nr:hypothetical protein [Tanacetum cinerariifolium]